MKNNIAKIAVTFFMLTTLTLQDANALPVSRQFRAMVKIFFKEATEAGTPFRYDEVFKPGEGGIAYIQAATRAKGEFLPPNGQLVITEVRASADDVATSPEVKAFLQQQSLNDNKYIRIQGELASSSQFAAESRNSIEKLEQQAIYARNTPFSTPTYEDILAQLNIERKMLNNRTDAIADLNRQLGELVPPAHTTQIGDATEISIYARKVIGDNTTYASAASKQLNIQLKNALNKLKQKYGDEIVKIHNSEGLLQRVGQHGSTRELIDFDGGISANIIVSSIDFRDYVNFLAEAAGIR